MNTSQIQAMVYESVMVRRQYGHGKTPGQISAMQVAKLVEEVGEYADTCDGLPFYLAEDIADVAQRARMAFDRPECWLDSGVRDPKLAAEELADIGVTWLCACEALGVDGLQLALAKAAKDEARGVR